MFINADEVASDLGVSRDHAYKIIRKLNQELKDQGYITVSGRVSRKFFKERLYLLDS